MVTTVKLFAILAILAALVLAGCASQKKDEGFANFQSAEQTIPKVELGALEKEAAIKRFEDFFGDITVENVRAKAPGLFAPDVYFNDTLKTLRGRDSVEAYFLKTTEHAEFVRAKVVDVSHSGGNYYLRWVMDVRFKGSKETSRTIGVTLLRFDREGRVTLHQDFWDSASGFYEHLPVLGGVMRWIKSKI
jgi:hypothetical protein